MYMLDIYVCVYIYSRDIKGNLMLKSSEIHSETVNFNRFFYVSSLPRTASVALRYFPVEDEGWHVALAPSTWHIGGGVDDGGRTECFDKGVDAARGV